MLGPSPFLKKKICYQPNRKADFFSISFFFLFVFNPVSILEYFRGEVCTASFMVSDREVVIVYYSGRAGFEHRASEEDALPNTPAPPDGHFSFEFDESYSQSQVAVHEFFAHKNMTRIFCFCGI